VSLRQVQQKVYRQAIGKGEMVG